MISLDQVLLLEEKVESAVQKIAQLNQENDALRIKCSELTKALSEKTEQLSSFSSDQSKIEEGILKALERLNSVEHSVLKAAALNQQAQNSVQTSSAAQSTQIPTPQIQNEMVHSEPKSEEAGLTAENSSIQTEAANQMEESADSSAISSTPSPDETAASSNSASPDKDNGQFYIF